MRGLISLRQNTSDIRHRLERQERHYLRAVVVHHSSRSIVNVCNFSLTAPFSQVISVTSALLCINRWSIKTLIIFNARSCLRPSSSSAISGGIARFRRLVQRSRYSGNNIRNLWASELFGPGNYGNSHRDGMVVTSFMATLFCFDRVGYFERFWGSATIY